MSVGYLWMGCSEIRNSLDTQSMTFSDFEDPNRVRIETFACISILPVQTHKSISLIATCVSNYECVKTHCQHSQWCWVMLYLNRSASVISSLSGVLRQWTANIFSFNFPLLENMIIWLRNYTSANVYLSFIFQNLWWRMQSCDMHQKERQLF